MNNASFRTRPMESQSAKPRLGPLLCKTRWRKKGVMATACSLIGLSLMAGTVTWRKNQVSSNWTAGENFEEGTAPSAGDTVLIPDECAVTLSDSDEQSWSLASSLTMVSLGARSRLVVTVDGEEATLACGIAHSANLWRPNATLEKAGSGMLNLTRNSGDSDYAVNISVAAGDLKMTRSRTTQCCGVLNVETGARFHCPASQFWLLRLTGGGEVVNDNGNYRFLPTATAGGSNLVEARMGSGIIYYSSGSNRIERTDNANPQFYLHGDGRTELVQLGLQGSASSAGTGNLMFEGPGCIRYIGTADETTDKNVYMVNPTGGLDSFDAGPHGGLTFTGIWGISNDAWGSDYMLGAFVLTGSNVVPCRIRGQMKNIANKWGKKQVYGIQKTGTGTWRLSNTENDFTAGVAVRDGTLQFDSLDEIGDPCSLGVATQLYSATDPGFGDYSKMTTCEHAIELGGRNGAPSTLEYTGTNSLLCTTRPIGLSGDARLVNSGVKPDGSEVRFRIRGVSSIARGTQTLILDGTATACNEVSDISDGALGHVGVTKRGAGTWIISGTNSFTGPLSVEQGKLIVRRSAPGERFTWFRLTFKEMLSSAEGVNGQEAVKIGAFALCDAEGNWLNVNADYCTDYADLEPGQVGYGRRWHVKAPYVMDGAGTVRLDEKQLCANGSAGDSSCLYYMRSVCGMGPDKPTTWFPIVLRLGDGVKAAVSQYDICTVYNADLRGSYPKHNPKAWMLEGSTDGLHWELLHEIADSMSDDPEQLLKIPHKGEDWKQYWMATQGRYWDGTTVHNGGQPVDGLSKSVSAPSLEDVANVSVANGAILEADGDITLSKFRAAAGATAGTVKGFKLAANCEIEVTGIAKGTASVRVPLTFEGVNPAESRWTAMDNGEVSRRFDAVVRNGRLMLVRKGLILVIR